MGNTSFLRVGIDARGARAGAAMFTSATSRIKRGAGSIVRTLNPLHMSLGKLGTYASIGGLAYGVNKAVKSYATFEKQLATVSTMLDKTTMDYLPKYERGLRSLSKKYGESTETLSKGLYDVLSASIDASKAMGVLEISVKAAKAGLTDTGVAADAITTILNSYGMSADQATRVSDILFATVKRGKTTFSELAGGIGQVASVAATAGLSLEEVGAAIATMTRAGIKSDMAITSLKNIITTFLNPTDDARKVAKELGIELSSATLQADGLTGVLARLKGATAEQLSAMMPNIRGFVGFAASIKQAEGQTKDLQLMMNSTGSTLEAFGKMSAIADNKFSRLKQSLVDASRVVGKAFMDDALAGVEALNSWLDKNQIKIEYWSSMASIEFTKLRKDVVAFAEYMQKDFSGAMDVAWDVFLAGIESASKAAISLAIRTGKGIWSGVKKGLGGYYTREILDEAEQAFEKKFGRMANRGGLKLSTGYDASYTYRRNYKNGDEALMYGLADEIKQSQIIESAFSGFDDELTKYREQYKTKKLGILALQSKTDTGKEFTDKLNVINAEADAHKLAAKHKRAFAELKQAAQPLIKTYNALIDKAKAFFGVNSSAKTSSLNKSGRANKTVVTKEMTDARADLDSMFSDLRNERRLIGLTNDERERAIELTKFQSLAKQAYADDTAKATEMERKYMEELEGLQKARELQVIADGIGDSFGRAFEDMVIGAKSASEAVKALVQDVARLVMQQMVTQPIANAISAGASGFFSGLWGSGGSVAPDPTPGIGTPMADGTMYAAMGAVFERGALVPMAYGDIVGSPTYFPMSGGRTGLMGEAGPEAVMPLTRTADGRLGVSSSGGRDSNIEVVVNVVNESGRPMEAKQGGTRFNGKQLITEVVLNDIHGYGPIRNAIQGIK